jgi:hypothetical protein
MLQLISTVRSCNRLLHMLLTKGGAQQGRVIGEMQPVAAKSPTPLARRSGTGRRFGASNGVPTERAPTPTA